MKTLIVGGGELHSAFLAEWHRKHPCDYVIAADAGLDQILEAGLVPDLILGDYDSLRSKESLEKLRLAGIPVETYPAEKDFSDTESALCAAIERGSTEIFLLGMCGGRLDHFLANVMDLLIPLKAGIPARIVDERNEIFLADRAFSIRAEEVDADYISFLPFLGEVTGLTLTGFKYELDGTQRFLPDRASYGISNEIIADVAQVSFDGGVLIGVFSKERPCF